MNQTEQDPNFFFRLLPIVFLESCLTLSLISFFSGIWKWPIENYFYVGAYAVAGQLCILFGYLSGMGKTPKTYTGVFRSVFGNPRRLVTILGILTVLYGIAMFVNLIVVTKWGAWDLFNNLLNPGNTYNYAYTTGNSRGGIGIPILFPAPIFLLGTIISFALIPITCVFWKKLCWYEKTVALLGIALRFLYYLEVGTNYVVLTTILICSALWWIGLYERRKMTFMEKIRYGIVVFCSLALFCLYFSYGMYQRNNSYTTAKKWSNVQAESPTSQKQIKSSSSQKADTSSVSPSNTDIQKTETEKTRTLLQDIKSKPGDKIAVVNMQHFLLKNSPPWLAHTIASITTYTSIGYWGLSVSFGCEYLPTGVGSSSVARGYVEKYTPFKSVQSRSFWHQANMKFGWKKHYVRTGYPDLASDFTFAGALLIVFFTGRFLAMTWNETFLQLNPVSAIVFMQLFMGIFFIPYTLSFFGLGIFEYLPFLLIWFFGRSKSAVPESMSEPLSA